MPSTALTARRMVVSGPRVFTSPFSWQDSCKMRTLEWYHMCIMRTNSANKYYGEYVLTCFHHLHYSIFNPFPVYQQGEMPSFHMYKQVPTSLASTLHHPPPSHPPPQKKQVQCNFQRSITRVSIISNRIGAGSLTNPSYPDRKRKRKRKRSVGLAHILRNDEKFCM